MHQSPANSNSIRHIPWRVLFTAVFSATAVLVSCSAVFSADPDQTLGDIVQSWGKRREQFEIVRVEWDERLIYAKGSIHSARSNLAKNAVDVPQAQQTLQFHATLLLHGSMMRYSGQTLRISADNEVFTLPYTSSFDGDRSVKLTTSNDDGHRGNIFTEKKNTDFVSSRMSPLMMFFRSAERFKRPLVFVMNETLDDKTSSVVIADKLNRVSIDPSRSYVILRWQELHPRGRITQQSDSTYTKDPQLGWIPKTWTLKIFDPYEPANVAISSECTVTKCEIDNTLSKRDFQLEFPSDTRFHDQRDGASYVVLADGSARKMTPEEDRFPAGGLSKGQYKVPIVILGALGIAALLVVLLWHKGRRKEG